MVGALLSFFLGGVGAHRYYLGYKKRGILMSIGCGCLLLGSILLGIGSANAVVSVYSGEGSGGAIVLTILSIPLMLVGTAVGIMALIDFIQILTGKLLPAESNPYQDSVPTQAPVNNTANSMEALEKLTKLHEQGILTDEEFQQKKTELLSKM